ncbi:MAG: hypothetical protein VX910_05710 [Candidatus Latescibacterota bacterium]|nr:hypothetical protein [Candidatus Latescibacterota bacterium]
MKEAVKLGKDREKKLAGEKAMSNGVFQDNWATFVDHLDQNYLGHDVSLKKFGTDVRFRKGFAHLMYVSLRSETRGLELDPSAQSVVGKYPFLQELMLQGSCYTGGDPFPKKVSDLLGANPGIPFLLAEHLDSWDKKYQKKFKKAYPKTN